MRRPAFMLGLVLALLLALPLGALATPAPTAAPVTPGGNGEPQTTPKPERTPAPTEPPTMAFTIPGPDRPRLLVGYTGNGIRPQAPLLVAEKAGYFDEAGFEQVIVARTNDVLAGVFSGDFEIGVVPATDAFTAFAEDPTLRAIAGYRNYEAGTGDYNGEILMAAPGLVSEEPATVLAFLNAYIRALDLLSTEEGAQEARDLLEATDLTLDVRPGAWTRSLQAFAPFDGGFGALEDGDGLGELTTHLTGDAEAGLDLEGFIADHTLAIAQTWRAQPANPASTLAGPPGIAEITVALPDADDAKGPMAAALEADLFSAAGFASVEVIDADQPLLGVLQGQVEFGVMDLRDVSEATAQGLPLAVIAAHRNYRADGSYGDDVIVASRDLLEQEGSTVSAFLVAYVGGLRGLVDQPNTDAFRPYDGGFGDRSNLGGLGEMAAYVGASSESEGDPARLRDVRSLEYAQAWWGLPANPTLSERVE